MAYVGSTGHEHVKTRAQSWSSRSNEKNRRDERRGLTAQWRRRSAASFKALRYYKHASHRLWLRLTTGTANLPLAYSSLIMKSNPSPSDRNLLLGPTRSLRSRDPAQCLIGLRNLQHVLARVLVRDSVGNRAGLHPARQPWEYESTSGPAS